MKQQAYLFLEYLDGLRLYMQQHMSMPHTEIGKMEEENGKDKKWHIKI